MASSRVWVQATPATAGGRQLSRGALGVLAVLVAAFGALYAWQFAASTPAIDYFTAWAVARSPTVAAGSNPYDSEAQERMAREAAAHAASPAGTPSERDAAAVTARLYAGRVDATGSPLLYTVFGALATGDYDRDRITFVTCSILALGVAFGALAFATGMPLTPAALLFLFVAVNWSPVLSDLRVGNVNAVQLAMVSVAAAGLARDRQTIAGIVLGLATAFKPTAAVACLFTLTVAAADRDWQRFGRLAGGVLAGAVLGIASSTWWFGQPAIWVEFVRSLARTLAPSAYPLEQGNFSLSALVGLSMPAAPALLVLAASGTLVWALRRNRLLRDSGPPASSTYDPRISVLALCLGNIAAVVASPLAWLHYFTALVPMLMALAADVFDTDGPPAHDTFRSMAVWLGLVLPSSLVEMLAAGNATREAAAVNAAAMLLFAGGLVSIANRPTGRNEPPHRPTRRANSGGRSSR